jgi:hypothetical protein
MREQLAEVLTRDPRAVQLLRGAHPRTSEQSDQSGERTVPGNVEQAPAPADAGRRAKAR